MLLLAPMLLQVFLLWVALLQLAFMFMALFMLLLAPMAVTGVSCPTRCWRPCIMMLQHDGIAVAGPHAVAVVSCTPAVAGVLAS